MFKNINGPAREKMIELKESAHHDLIYLASLFEDCEDRAEKSDRDIALLSLAQEIRHDLWEHSDIFESSKLVVTSTPDGVRLDYVGHDVAALLPSATYDSACLDDYCAIGRDVFNGTGLHVDDAHGRVVIRGRWGWQTRLDFEFFAKIEEFVNKASHYYNASLYSDKSQPMYVLARLILSGYASEYPFKAVKTDVIRISNELRADLMYHCDQDKMVMKSEVSQKYILEALDAAVQRGDINPEYNSQGAMIERGSLSESMFYRLHNPESGFLMLPTGQEPYTMTKLNLSTRTVATYSEGDYTLAVCANDQILDQEVLAALSFYAEQGYIFAPELTGLDQTILDRLPHVAEFARGQGAEFSARG